MRQNIIKALTYCQKLRVCVNLNQYWKLSLNILIIEPQYSDSYFYSSSSMNYPTIQEQKQMAKLIAERLEQSDPSKSKYHKYKNMPDNIDEASEDEYSYYGQPYHQSNQIERKMKSNNSFADDLTIPDIIRESIRQAEMTDPTEMVYAPEEFKQKHFIA